MALPQLKRLDKEEVHAGGDKNDLGDMLHKMVQKVLECSDGEVADIF